MVWVLATAVCLVAGGIAVAWRSRRRVELRAELLDRLALGCRRQLSLPPWLEAAARERKDREGGVYEILARRLDEGTNLADALEELPRPLVPAHVVGAVRAAEGTARLSRVLEAAAEDAGETLSFRHRAYLASLYPVLLAVLVLALHFTAYGVFYRVIARFYAPRSWTSFTGFTLAVALAGGAAALVLLSLLLRRFGLFPGAWRLGTARVLSTGAQLVSAGVPLTEALDRAAPAAGHRRIARRVRDAAERIDGGETTRTLWAALRLRAVDRLRLDAAGARVAAVLTDVAATSLTRWRAVNDAWLRWLGPVAVIVVGLLVLVDFRMVMGALESAREACRVRPW